MADSDTTGKTPAVKKMAVTKALKFDVDSDLIRRLAALLEETGLSEIELGDGDHHLRVARGGVRDIIQVETTPPSAPPPGAGVSSTKSITELRRRPSRSSSMPPSARNTSR